MGRLWLALALLIALGASAFGDVPVTAPGIPRLTSATLEIGPQRTGGLYEIERLRIEATFGPSVSLVRISIGSTDPKATIETTPDHLDLVRPPLLAPSGRVHIYVSGVDAARNASPLAVIDVIADDAEQCALTTLDDAPHDAVQRRPDGPLGLAVVAFAPIALALGLAVALTVLSRRKAAAECSAPAEPIALAAAEHLARVVRLRALLLLATLAAAAAFASTVASEAVIVAGLLASPVLIVLAVVALARLVAAFRSLRLLARADATATVRLHQIVVQIVVAANRHRVVLPASRWLVERARSHALPRATL